MFGKKQMSSILRLTVCLTMFAALFLSFGATGAEAKTISWRLQDIATAGQIHYDWRTKFCENVKAMSGGRLVIKQFPSGALVKGNELFEAVANGSIQVAVAASPYWSGIVGKVALMGWCLPYAYEDPRQLDNFLQGPYMDTMREVVAKHGVHYLGTQLVSSYPIISTKPINNISDLAELKIRCVGLTAFTLKKVGARTVYVPAEEIYTGLATGVFDGCTWGGPSQTHSMGLHEVCKYYLLPPVASVCYNECIINGKAWEKLPDDLKAIVRTAWDAIRWPTFMAMETIDEKYLKDYVANHGVTVTRFSDADKAKMREASLAAMDEEVVQKDPAGKKLVELLKKDLQSLGYIQ